MKSGHGNFAEVLIQVIALECPLLTTVHDRVYRFQVTSPLLKF